MSTQIYNIKDLKALVKESVAEFKPVLGKNVANDNKKINDKAYADMTKEVKDYDGGKTNKPQKHQLPMDDNRGMQDLEYTNMNDEFKKRVQSQMKGYTSAEDEKLHKNAPFGNADFSEIDGMKEKHDTLHKGKEKAKEIGLTSREIDKKDFENLKHSVFENKKPITLKWKKTVFVTENQMLNKVPDEYKTEGRTFIMKDMNNTEYLVEWHVDDDPKVINTTKVLNEQKRIKNLFEYKRGETTTNVHSRLQEEANVSDMLGKVRKLMK